MDQDYASDILIYIFVFLLLIPSIWPESNFRNLPAPGPQFISSFKGPYTNANPLNEISERFQNIVESAVEPGSVSHSGYSELTALTTYINYNYGSIASSATYPDRMVGGTISFS